MRALFTFFFLIVAQPGLAAMPALEAARSLVGKYTGSWRIYEPVDANLTRVKMEWKDTLEAQDPRIEGERAVVTVKGSLDFTIPSVFSVPQDFVEGFYVNKDGSAGKRFFTGEGGKVVVEDELDAETTTFRSAVDPASHAALGITAENAIYAGAFTVKRLTVRDGLETHQITQTTTLVWKDAQGKVRSREFVSLKGTHSRRIP